MMFIRLFDLITFVILHDKLAIQHYTSPPHPCLSAQICNHTGKALCGIEKNEKHIRMFLDECDMFEYNCDNHKTYVSTEFFHCKQSSETTTVTLQTLQSTSIEVNYTTNEITKSSLFQSDNVTIATVSETSQMILNLTTNSLTTVATSPTTTTIISSSKSTTSILNISQSISTSIQSTLDTSISTMDDKNATDTTLLMTTVRTPFKSTTEITTEITTEMTTKMSTIDDKNTTNVTMSTLTTCTALPQNITTSHIKEKPDCCSTTQSIKEASVKTALTEATLTTINEKNNTKHFEITDTTSISQSVATLLNCEYPKHCDRPRTWEVTAKGETRDFYQILKARYGNRVKILRDTTHWPPYLKDVDDTIRSP